MSCIMYLFTPGLKYILGVCRCLVRLLPHNSSWCINGVSLHGLLQYFKCRPHLVGLLMGQCVDTHKSVCWIIFCTIVGGGILSFVDSNFDG